MPKPKNRQEYREQVTQAFIHVLEQDGLSWKRGWDLVGGPRNAVTERGYSGINRLYLSLLAMSRGYTDPRWCTMLQIMDRGGKYHPGQTWHLQAGSKAEYVEYWYPYDAQERKAMSWSDYRTLPADERDSDRYTLRVRYTPVFHASMIEGMPPLEIQQREPQPLDQVVSRLSGQMGVSLSFDGQDQAFYRPMDDTVHLPDQAAFHSPYELNATALHELTHATGHPSRLNRPQNAAFGTPAYAYEELVAEMGACFMGIDLDTEQMPRHMENHKAYVQSWIQLLQEQPEQLAAAIGDAQKAADYMEVLLEQEVVQEATQPVATSIQVPVERTKEPEEYIGRKVDHGRVFEIIGHENGKFQLQSTSDDSHLELPYEDALHDLIEVERIATVGNTGVYYMPDGLTRDRLSDIATQHDQYAIVAPTAALSDEWMVEHHIQFYKLGRDIPYEAVHHRREMLKLIEPEAVVSIPEDLLEQEYEVVMQFPGREPEPFKTKAPSKDILENTLQTFRDAGAAIISYERIESNTAKSAPAYDDAANIGAYAKKTLTKQATVRQEDGEAKQPDYIAPELVALAKEQDVLDILLRAGEPMTHKNHEYRSVAHDSLAITEGKGFYWFSRQMGSRSPIDYYMWTQDLSFQDATRKVLDAMQVDYRAELQQPQRQAERKQPPAVFALPERAENDKRAYAYLTKTRHIDPQLVSELMGQGLVYQTAKGGNVAFVGKDYDGNPASAFKRSTLTINTPDGWTRGDEAGSQKEYRFRIENPNSRVVNVFESEIDLLSYLSMRPADQRTENYISLGGVSDRALTAFLAHREVDRINVCTDNDQAGERAAESIREKLGDRYEVTREWSEAKDWNEDLSIIEQARQRQLTVPPPALAVEDEAFDV